MKILIIRHGDPDYELDSLTPKGWREAKLLSERMKTVKVDDIYVSPLGRARDTARDTENILSKKAVVLDWLKEFSGEIVSPYTGEMRIPWDLAPMVWGCEEKYFDRKNWHDTELMHTGDSKKVYDSTAKSIDFLLEKYGLCRHGMIYKNEEKEEKTIALFCHCVMGLTVISHLAGISPFVLWHNFFLPPTSVSTLVTETDKDGFCHFRCVQTGDTSHLYAANEPISESGLYPEFEF